MHTLWWVVAGLLLTRPPFVEAAAPLSAAPVAVLPPLRVSDNHRFLVAADGGPFFWLDGEPIYEDTPDAVWIVKRVDGPRAGADAVRRKAYWSVFSGACGHTYGHNDVYGFFTPPGQLGAGNDWVLALDDPARQLPAPGSARFEPAAIHQPWPMHHVCRDFLIANSLSAADVDGDGLDDYSVIDERRGLMTIIFHPGKNGDLRHEWPRLILGETGNPEYACLGDLDGDGAPDFITVEGDDLSRGLLTGVRIIWNPGKDKARDPAAWQDAGRLPGTENAQYLYAECHDVNGDGALDLVVGGRKHPITKQYAGLRWLRAPTDRKARRDLAKWTTHFLDADTPSGHGFVFADINGDGHPDLVDANADWDTPRHEQELYWYENPGAGTPAQLQPWPRHSIWKSTEFYAKPQTAVGDYDGDGLPDIATQTQNFIHFFRCTTRSPVAWQHLRAMKPDWIQWLGRPVKFADLNGDGRLDLVAALIHNDGNLPKDKASVFWLENNGGAPDSWRIHPIKWSDGANTRDPWIGEKWDHLLALDLDGDGDLDLLGNVEEHYHRGPDGKDVSWFSVVWFENPRQ